MGERRALHDQFAWWLASITRELTLFAACGMLLGGIDDLAIDLLWFGHGWWRRRVTFARTPMPTMANLPAPVAPGRLAIFVPAWDESDVIGTMLKAACERWRGEDCHIFVGLYPNDPDTLHAIERVGDARIRAVSGARPGPTSKGECLNRIWRAMVVEEARSSTRYKAVVLHDAEDVVHPLEIALYDRMIERFDLVQIPVFPLPAHGEGLIARTVAAVYCDEFADAHGRQLIIREAIGASVPSAGVGCAVRRDFLGRVADARDGEPFDESSLTEDYELGLLIVAMGGRGAFVTIPAKPGALPVAVRAHFPESVRGSIRQKARWVTGIALAGWDRLGWRGGLAERWMRFRDRRSLLAAIVLSAGYVAFLLNVGGWSLGLDLPPGLLRTILWVTFVAMLWRMALRAIVVSRIYGPIAGLLAMPRMLVASVIAIGAAARALWLYRPGKPMKWDKTAHVFPGSLPCD